MHRFHALITVFVISLLSFVLSACGKDQSVTEEVSEQNDLYEVSVPEESALAVYSVTFDVEGETIFQKVTEGETPSILEFGEGVQVIWKDEDGLDALPFDEPVMKDQSYVAELTYEVSPVDSFLKVDINGFVYPDGLATPDDLKQVIEKMIINEHKRDQIIDSIADGWKLTLDKVINALADVFEEDMIDAAFEGCSELITRKELAVGIYYLTGVWQNTVVFSDYPVVPVDADIQKEPAILCSLNAFSVDDNGWDPSQAILKCRWESGYYFNCGYMYYADEKDNLARNVKIGTSLSFGDDCRYTTGYQDLDDVCAETIYQFIKAEPDQGREEWLWKSFLWVAYESGCTYGATWEASYGDNDGDWVYPLGYEMLTDYFGDCYGFAGGFGLLARNLGYDAHCIAGLIFGGSDSHGWVEIRDEDGLSYFYDPQTAYRAHYGQRTSHGLTCFHEPMENASLFSFVWEDVVYEDQGIQPYTDPQLMIDSEESEEEDLSETQSDIDPEEAVAYIREHKKESVDVVLDYLGEPLSKEYSGSCMGPGDDGLWVYDGLIVYTYLEDGVETITHAMLDQ